MFRFLYYISRCKILTPALTHHQGWMRASDSLRQEAQVQFGCCGFDSLSSNDSETSLGHPSCAKVHTLDGKSCCPESTGDDDCCVDNCVCDLCKPKLVQAIANSFSAVGGVGLFFSFTEVRRCRVAGVPRVGEVLLAAKTATSLFVVYLPTSAENKRFLQSLATKLTLAIRWPIAAFLTLPNST